MGEGRQVARRGSPAQLPVVCGLGLTALDSRGGRRQADLGCLVNRREGRSHVLSSSPWVLGGFSAFPTLNKLYYVGVGHRAGLWLLRRVLRYHILSSFLIVS